MTIRILLILSIWFILDKKTAESKDSDTRTPIKHLVVIFQENRTFDHYFGTYPHAENRTGERAFHPKKNTPSINGLTKALRKSTTNLTSPFRLSPSEVNTSNPGHTYTLLQQACGRGLMDQFVQTTGSVCPNPSIVMGYFDGNTVTALWNYAQYFSMSDNFHSTTIAGSTVGAVNLISGQLHGATPSSLTYLSIPIVVQGTLLNDIDPKYDRCSKGPTVELKGKNIGNRLNAKKITWGWFQGGFRSCTASHIGPEGLSVVDYVPHHNPFQFYRSTSNARHKSPSSVKKIGYTDRANHLYDLDDFWKALKCGNLPSVSFLKAPAYQNGHAVNSNPLLEQSFLVSTINRLQMAPQWKDMAIIIAYDDSGGWYDHEMPPIINESQCSADGLISTGNSGNRAPFGGYQGRLGYGMRLPFILISPWAKENYVEHSLIDQTSILRFIEYNWKLKKIGNFSFDSRAGRLDGMFNFTERKLRYLYLDPETGDRLLLKKSNY